MPVILWFFETQAAWERLRDLHRCATGATSPKASTHTADLTAVQAKGLYHSAIAAALGQIIVIPSASRLTLLDSVVAASKNFRSVAGLESLYVSLMSAAAEAGDLSSYMNALGTLTQLGMPGVLGGGGSLSPVFNAQNGSIAFLNPSEFASLLGIGGTGTGMGQFNGILSGLGAPGFMGSEGERGTGGLSIFQTSALSEESDDDDSQSGQSNASSSTPASSQSTPASSNSPSSSSGTGTTSGSQQNTSTGGTGSTSSGSPSDGTSQETTTAGSVQSSPSSQSGGTGGDTGGGSAGSQDPDSSGSLCVAVSQYVGALLAVTGASAATGGLDTPVAVGIGMTGGKVGAAVGHWVCGGGSSDPKPGDAGDDQGGTGKINVAGLKSHGGDPTGQINFHGDAPLDPSRMSAGNSDPGENSDGGKDHVSLADLDFISGAGVVDPVDDGPKFDSGAPASFSGAQPIASQMPSAALASTHIEAAAHGYSLAGITSIGNQGQLVPTGELGKSLTAAAQSGVTVAGLSVGAVGSREQAPGALMAAQRIKN